MTEEEVTNFHEVAELIRTDPVTCMRHFDHRYRALLNILLKNDCGIFSPFKLKDYFSRLEFQMRGSPHSHGLYWIEDAPLCVERDFQSEKEVLFLLTSSLHASALRMVKWKTLLIIKFTNTLTKVTKS
jgi:hypothetical protein